MDEKKSLKTKLLPYLKLRESEEIIIINKFDEKIKLPTKELAKNHDPNTLPVEFFPIIGKNYEFYEFNIITNYRVIFFSLNLNYFEEDGITPLSKIFHSDNYLFWIRNEDIMECDIDFGGFVWSGFSIKFKFYISSGENSRKLSAGIRCSDYKNYLQVKHVLTEKLGLPETKMNVQERAKIHSIRSTNLQFLIYGLIMLALLGVYIIGTTFTEEDTNYTDYADLVVYVLYVCFFIVFNLYFIRKMNRNLKVFFEFSGKYFEWYKGPWISILIFLVLAVVFIIDLGYTLIISNYIFSFLASVGTFGVFYGITYLIIRIVGKKRKTSIEIE